MHYIGLSFLSLQFWAFFTCVLILMLVGLISKLIINPEKIVSNLLIDCYFTFGPITTEVTLKPTMLKNRN